MKKIIEIMSFMTVVFLFAFSFVALFANNWLLVGVGLLIMVLLYIWSWEYDRRERKRRKAFWKETGL